jgi:hypothetical protein
MTSVPDYLYLKPITLVYVLWHALVRGIPFLLKEYNYAKIWSKDVCLDRKDLLYQIFFSFAPCSRFSGLHS